MFLSLSGWEWVSIIGVLLVFIGVAGLRVATPKTEKKRWEQPWEGILIVGLAVEIVSLGHDIKESARLHKEVAEARQSATEAAKQAILATERALHVESTNVTLATQLASLEATNLVLRANIAGLHANTADMQIQVARAHERTALTESNNLVLKRELAQVVTGLQRESARIAQTDSNLSKIDPLNLPIVSATAEVSFFIVRTNSSKSRPKIETDLNLNRAFTRFRFKDPDANDFPIYLEFDGIEVIESPGMLSGDMVFVRLRFKSDGLGLHWITSQQSAKWEKLSPARFDEFKEGEIPIFGLPDETKIFIGACTITFNSTIQRSFLIDRLSGKDKIVLRAAKRISKELGKR